MPSFNLAIPCIRVAKLTHNKRSRINLEFYIKQQGLSLRKNHDPMM